MKRRARKRPTAADRSSARRSPRSARQLLALVDWLIEHKDWGGLQIIIDDCLGIEGRKRSLWPASSIRSLFRTLAHIAPCAQVSHMVQVAKECQVTIRELEKELAADRASAVPSR